MTTTENKFYIEFKSADYSGPFILRIHKGPSFQILLQSEDDSTTVNVDINELKAIRDCINKVIGNAP